MAWAAGADEPEIIGDPTLVTAADTPQRVLAFGTWLEPETRRRHGALGRCAARAGHQLRHDADDARRPIIEAEGQVIGGRAILRLREVSGIKYELAELARRHQKHIDDTAACAP